MQKFKYYLTDVFTDKKFSGNPLAVFPNADEIPENLYQIIAREMNLSETTFILPAAAEDAAFRLRIFTPFTELPIAGHPTIGTAFVVKDQNLLGKTGKEIIIEEKIGRIKVSFNEVQDKEYIWMEQPVPSFNGINKDIEQIAAMLSVDKKDIDTSLPIEYAGFDTPLVAFVPLKNLDAIGKAVLRTDLYDAFLKATGVRAIMPFTLQTVTKDASVHARMFAPALGIIEDPATGGACGPLGIYLNYHNVFPAEKTIICEQGFEMGRPSKLLLQVIKKDQKVTGINVGGQAVLIGEGYLYVD